MAKDLDLKIVIKAQVDKAKKALQDLKGRLSGAGSAAKEMGTKGSAGASRFEKAMDRVRQSTSKTTGVLQRAKRAAASFWGTVVGVATGTIIGGIIRINASFQKLHASLQTVTGSTKAADAAFDDIKEFAKTTPFQVEEITSAFIKLKALGLEPSMAALRSYGNTASAMGKTLDQFVEAVADAAVGEFERLKEFGIKASSEGDRVKFTFQGVTTEIGKNAKEIEQYLRGLGDTQFAGAMERQMNTIGGAFSNLKDTIADVASAIGEAGLNQIVIDMLKQAAEALRKYKPDIVTGMNVIVKVFTVAGATIRGVFNSLTAVFGSVAAGVSWLAEQILRALSAITFGDLSAGYQKMADDMQRITRSLVKGVVTDLKDIQSSVGDIALAFDDEALAKQQAAAKKVSQEIERQNAAQTEAQRKANLERKALDDIRKADAEEAAKAQQGVIERETEALKEALKRRESAYKAHLDKVKSYKEQQKSIDEEFAKAAEELLSDKPAENQELDLLDASAFEAKAGQQIADGDFKGAIESARAGIEVLKQLKEQGGQSNVVLSGMAEIFRSIAAEASQGQVDAQVVDAESTESEIDKIKAKLAELEAAAKGNTIKIKAELDTADLANQIKAAVAQAQADAPPVTIRTSYKGVGSSGERVFSDGTGSFEDALDQEVIARGSR